MTGPFQGQSMAQFLGEAAKGFMTCELSRAFLGFEIPMKEVAKRLGREVGAASGGGEPMEEEVSEAEASSGDEAAASSGEAAAASSGAAAEASRKRQGSPDEPTKNKKPKKNKKTGQQSIFGFFSVAKKDD